MSAITFSLTDPIKLTNVEKNEDIVTFASGLKGRATFTPEYKHIQTAMEKRGLAVPVGQEKDYSHLKADESRIRLSHDDFGIAFYELYYRRSMNPDVFKWLPLKA